LGCSVSHSRRKEEGGAYLEDALVAGEGLGEDRTNDAADRSSAPGKEEHGRSPREGKKQREEMNLRP